VRLGTIRRDRRTGRRLIVQVRLRLRPFNREGVHKMLLVYRLLHASVLPTCQYGFVQGPASGLQMGNCTSTS
jgi:hypothetical protein